MVAIPLNSAIAGDLSAKLGGLVVQPSGAVKATPAYASVVTAETGTSVSPADIQKVVNANVIDPASNITSMVNSINTSDVGTIDGQGNITDYIGKVSNGVSSFFTDMLGSTGGNIAEYGFFGLLAVAAVYVGRKIFHSKTGLGRPKF